jgi:hypothetical protein
MVAATFRSSGAFMGDHLIPGTPSNPNGYYEDREINYLNDQLIGRMLGTPFLGWRIRRRFFRTVHSVRSAFFLAAPRKLRTLQLTSQEEEKIRWFVQREPFCYKDPRFSVTLPLWRPYLPKSTRFIVVFRDPMRTVESMLRDAREQSDPPLPITPRQGWVCWMRTYARLLALSEGLENWMFVDYNGRFDASTRMRLAEFSEAALDFSQIDPRVSRTTVQQWPDTAIARKCRGLYDRMCARAAH